MGCSALLTAALIAVAAFPMKGLTCNPPAANSRETITYFCAEEKQFDVTGWKEDCALGNQLLLALLRGAVRCGWPMEEFTREVCSFRCRKPQVASKKQP